MFSHLLTSFEKYKNVTARVIVYTKYPEKHVRSLNFPLHSVGIVYTDIIQKVRDALMCPSFKVFLTDDMEVLRDPAIRKLLMQFRKRHGSAIMMREDDMPDEAVTASDFPIELIDDWWVGRTLPPQTIQAVVMLRILRALQFSESTAMLIAGDIVLDLDSHATRVNGASKGLSVLESKLLGEFIKNTGRLLSRGAILKSVWGDTHVLPRTIDAHVASLRRKLSDSKCRIESIYSAGYIFRSNEL